MNQAKEILIGIGATALIFGGIIFFAGQTQKNPEQNSAAINGSNSNGTISAEHSSFDFGSISMSNGNVRHDFTVKNTSGEQATLKKLYTSCMCTTASLKINGRTEGPFGMAGHGFIPSFNQALAPGEEATIEVVFDPNAHGPAGVGKIERVIYIEMGSSNTLELNVSANVTP